MKKLSPRETEILQYLVLGYTNEEIANTLYLSIDTVKMYLKSIFKKLEVSNRVMAAVKTITTGIVKIDEIKCSTKFKI